MTDGGALLIRHSLGSRRAGFATVRGEETGSASTQPPAAARTPSGPRRVRAGR